MYKRQVEKEEANSWPVFGAAVAKVDNAWTSNNWSGTDDGGWGQSSGTSAQGEGTGGAYARFTGTFHEGRFYADKSFGDLWIHDGSITASVTIRQKDFSLNTSPNSNVISITYDNLGPAFTSGTTATAIDENSGASQTIYTAVSDDTAIGNYTLSGNLSLIHI